VLQRHCFLDIKEAANGVFNTELYTWSSTYDLCDLRPAALTTTKKKNNKLINKLIINQEVTTEDTHNPGEEAHR
jgi:hypothetical protein